MFLVTSPIVINVPTRGLLAVETMHAIVSVAGKFEYQKKYDVNVCKQETSLLSLFFGCLSVKTDVLLEHKAGESHNKLGVAPNTNS